MAELKPIGINLTTGQVNYAHGGDTLRPDTGNLTISAGNSSADGAALNLFSGDPAAGDFGGGQVLITASSASDNADGGGVTIRCGDGGFVSGSGGSFFLRGGDGNGSGGSGGSIEFVGGDSAGIATGGSITLTTGDGYDNGGITIGIQSLSTTPDGGLVIITGGSDGEAANYALTLQTLGVSGSPSSSSILIQTGAADVPGNIDIDSGLAATTGGVINIGMQNASAVNIGGLNSSSATFGSTTTGGLTAGDALAEAGLIKVRNGFTSIGDNSVAAGLSFGPLYYDTKNGTYVQFGNSVYIDGNGVNNLIRAGDGDDTHTVFPYEATADGDTYSLATAGAIDTDALEPGSVTVRIILSGGSAFSEVTDNGAGVFASGAVLPSGGTVDYVNRTLTGTTAGLEDGSRVEIAYQTANTAGENITVRSGNGFGTAAGGNITISSGTGGTTGDSGDVIIDAGTVTSGTVGDILIGTTSATNITIGDSDASSQNILFNNRAQGQQGVDVASAADITLTIGNYFDITGTTTINTISGTGWRAGSVVILQFDSALTVSHLTAGTGAQIRLNGATNFTATAGSTLTLVYSGTVWIETARMTA